MVNALWITLIGMGLVFLAILMLWGLMALLVRLTAEKPASAAGLPAPERPVEGETAQEVLPAEAVESLPLAGDLRGQRRRAAAAGVAVAMALQQGSRRQPDPVISLGAWQSVQRAAQLGQRHAFSRKVRE